MECIEAIVNLSKIFKDKKWFDDGIDKVAFDGCCQLLSNLTDIQRNLIIELLERYTWIPLRDYHTKVLNMLEEVEYEKLEKLRKVYLFPIIEQNDVKTEKSGNTVIYLIKAYKYLLDDVGYKSIKFEILTKFEDFNQSNITLKDDEAIFLIDDYIGSGNTLNTCINTIKILNPHITDQKINILSIVSQKEIFEKISKTNYSIYSVHILPKGITDFYKSPLLEEKIEIMKGIEKMVSISQSFHLGYAKTEGLITMIRTPNNTFPIFWKEHKKGGIKFDAPFRRS